MFWVKVRNLHKGGGGLPPMKAGNKKYTASTNQKTTAVVAERLGKARVLLAFVLNNALQ
jgi:hypothetical protein